MAHQLTQSDTMFSVRQMPWHGLGVVLDAPPADIDEALIAAGLEWTVEQRPIYVPQKGGGMYEAIGWRANVRRDTEDVLGIVSEEYAVVQNRDAFQFLNDLLGTELHFETAGSLGGNRKVWVLARRPDHILVGGDATYTYVFITSSHDGSLAVTVAPTNIRIVCANTLGMALRGADGQPLTFKLRHTQGVEGRAQEARETMQLTVDHEVRFKKLGDDLARKRITERKLGLVLEELFPVSDVMGERAARTRTEAREACMLLFKGRGWDGDTTGNAPGTAWCAWNAIAEHQDWHRRYTETTDQVVRSFEDTAVKDRALELLVAA